MVICVDYNLFNLSLYNIVEDDNSLNNRKFLKINNRTVRKKSSGAKVHFSAS